jgi:putative two-component system response regulator
MRIASLLSSELTSALEVWLDALGHSVTNDPNNADRLILNFSQLSQPIKTTIAPCHWLLLDSQLTIAKTIRALQLRCGYIATAPLQRNTFDQWLAGTELIEDMFNTNGSQSLAPQKDHFIGPFIDLLTKNIWDKDLREQAKETLVWRDIALQLPQFKRLQESHKLTPLQHAQLACHTITGAQLLAPQNPLLAQITAQHHEHFDGTGYPAQLQGEQIHPMARLAKLYDSYTGLRRHKSYAKALSHELSMQKLLHGDGYLWPSQFDPELLGLLAANATELAVSYQSWHRE